MGVNGLTGILSRYAPNSVRVVSSSAFAGQAIAVDASCHLNKFIYGDEPHLHRHIYGFYQLARFFDINKIKPIFVFDGPRRIKAKELEYAKRQRAREKVKYSLLFEKEQSTRLNHWMEMSDQYHQSNYSPTKESLLTILGELGESIDQIELDLPPEKEERIVSLDKQHEIEGQLASVAQELRTALQTVEDTEYYTKTVRELARREKALIAEMIMNHFNGTKSALKMLKRDNQAMLFSLEKRSYRITQALRDECQEFLKTLGYVCFTCNDHEAEAMCAHLSKIGRTTATVSEDLDTLAFGDAPLLRYFYARNRPILSIDPIQARTDLQLSRESFIDFCILCGTDFSGTIQGIGPHRALAAIKKYGSIESLLEHLNPKYIPQDTFNYKLAREVFNDLPPIPVDNDAYEPLTVSQIRMSEMLKQFDIDPMEAESRVRMAMLQQNFIHSHDWGANPFDPSSVIVSI